MVTTGMPVTPGIDFSGGTAVTVITPDTKDQIQAIFSEYPLTDISEGVNNGKFLKFSSMDDTKFRSLTALIMQKYPDAKIDQIGEPSVKPSNTRRSLRLFSPLSVWRL